MAPCWPSSGPCLRALSPMWASGLQVVRRDQTGGLQCSPVGGHIPDALGKSEWPMEKPVSKLTSWLMAPHWASLTSPLRADMGPTQHQHHHRGATTARAPGWGWQRSTMPLSPFSTRLPGGAFWPLLGDREQLAPRPGPLRKGATLHSALPGPGLGREADWESHWPHVTRDPGPAWPHTLGETQGGQSRGARRHTDVTRPPGLPSLLPAPTESLTSLMDTF